MLSASLFSAAFAMVMLCALPTFSETPLRVRGQVVAVDDESVTVGAKDGNTFRLLTDTETVYADVVSSNLDAIRNGSFIGSAVKGGPGHFVAVEIVLVPEAMRAGRVGLYDWDLLPDTSGIDPSGSIATSMTNGSVSAVSAVLMNANAKAGPGRLLTVDLVSGKTVDITVSRVAPIVEFVPSSRSTVVLGSPVVVWTAPGNQIRLIAVGKGLTPPM
jgi:hypothetical protein